MGKLFDALTNLLNASADKQRVQQQDILMQQKKQMAFNQYQTEYCHIADRVVMILNKIQTKKTYFMPFDISTVTSAFYDYQKNNTMPFCIPWAYRPSEQEYKKIMELIRDNLLPELSNMYPQYRNINVFYDGVFGIRSTSYGFDLVSLRGSFY